MRFDIQEAVRELVWCKIALMGSSGSGKTYSALRLATGMLAELEKLGLAGNGKIVMANTEGPRGKYYAKEFKYSIQDLASPYEPEMYSEFINYAVKEGYPILIIDSTSHEWEGRGGCLEIHQREGGTFQAWGKVTPRHNKFIETLADSPIHIIATMRGKDQYEIDQDEKGKKNIKKLGVGAKQREGFEYEFSATFLLDQKSNMATVQKDNTHLFENDGSIKFTEEHGVSIIDWANSGEGYTPPVRNRETTEDVQKTMRMSIIALAKECGGSKDPGVMEVMKKYEPEAGNPARVTDVNQLKLWLTDMETLKTTKEIK